MLCCYNLALCLAALPSVYEECVNGEPDKGCMNEWGRMYYGCTSLEVKNLGTFFCKECKSIVVCSDSEMQLLFVFQVWDRWMVRMVGGLVGMACYFLQCMMGARSCSAVSRLRSKPLGSSLILVGAHWASITLWPKSISPRCQPASKLLESSQLWAWARANWGCTAAFPLHPMCSLVRTQPTGSLVTLVEVGGAGRLPSSLWGKWYRSLRSWLCQTQTQAWCPVLDHPPPP